MSKVLKFIWVINMYSKRNIRNKLTEHVFTVTTHVNSKSLLDSQEREREGTGTAGSTRPGCRLAPVPRGGFTEG